MLVLDTNVISEIMRPAPDARLVAWLDAQALETLYLAAMVVAELRAGIALMPHGQKRSGLDERLERRVLPLFAGRILSFDLECTKSFALVLASAKQSGSGIETADACIAAIALSHGFAVATRDEHPFKAAGVTVHNPWTSQVETLPSRLN